MPYLPGADAGHAEGVGLAELPQVIVGPLRVGNHPSAVRAGTAGRQLRVTAAHLWQRDNGTGDNGQDSERRTEQHT